MKGSIGRVLEVGWFYGKKKCNEKCRKTTAMSKLKACPAPTSVMLN